MLGFRLSCPRGSCVIKTQQALNDLNDFTLARGISLIGVAFKQRPCSWGGWEIFSTYKPRRVPEIGGIAWFFLEVTTILVPLVLDFGGQTSDLICFLPFTSPFLLSLNPLCSAFLAGKIPLKLWCCDLFTVFFQLLARLAPSFLGRWCHEGLASHGFVQEANLLNILPEQLKLQVRRSQALLWASPSYGFSPLVHDELWWTNSLGFVVMTILMTVDDRVDFWLDWTCHDWFMSLTCN